MEIIALQVPEVECHPRRTSTLRLAAKPDEFVMASAQLALVLDVLGLFIAVFGVIVLPTGGGLCLFIPFVMHGICIGITAWDPHAGAIILAYSSGRWPTDTPPKGTECPARGRMYPGPAKKSLATRTTRTAKDVER